MDRQVSLQRKAKRQHLLEQSRGDDVIRVIAIASFDGLNDQAVILFQTTQYVLWQSTLRNQLIPRKESLLSLHRELPKCPIAHVEQEFQTHAACRPLQHLFDLRQRQLVFVFQLLNQMQPVHETVIVNGHVLRRFTRLRQQSLLDIEQDSGSWETGAAL